MPIRELPTHLIGLRTINKSVGLVLMFDKGLGGTWQGNIVLFMSSCNYRNIVFGAKKKEYGSRYN